MALKHDELIARYFEHKMSSKEEQNFLITLAASDELRLQFRSHLELMKAVRQDKDDMRPVAQVRNRTMAALGLSTAVVSQFFEHGLVQEHKYAAQQAAQPLVQAPVAQATVAEPITATKGLLTSLRGIVRSRAVILSAGLVLGFAAAFSYSNQEQSTTKDLPASGVQHISVSAPNPVSTQSTVEEQPRDAAPATSQVAEPSTAPKEISKHQATRDHRSTLSVDHAALQDSQAAIATRQLENKPATHSGVGTMRSHTVITKPGDSAK